MVFESKTNQPSYVCQTLAILLRFKKYKKVVGDFFYKYPLGLQVDDLLAYIETAPNEENSTEFAESMEGENSDLNVKSTALFQHLIYGRKWPAKHTNFKRDPMRWYLRNSSRLVSTIIPHGYHLDLHEGIHALTRSSHSVGSGWICYSCHSPTTIIDTCVFCGASKIQSEKAQLKLDRHRKEQVRLARIEAVRLEEERLAAIETARLAAIEADRIVKERLAAIEAARLETERLEKERLAAIEAERLETERLEKQRLAAIEAERLETERLEKQRLAAIEAARLETERLEKERLAAIEAERLEAERLEKQRLAAIEAERLEAERLEKERLAAIEAERLETERLEKERLAAIEAERLETERLEKERLAAIKADRLMTERLEKERLAAIEAERLLHEIEQQRDFDEKLRASNMSAEQKIIAGGYYADGLQPELIFPLMLEIIDEHTVIQFRKQEWIKQYDLDDPFIMMILEGKISITSAEELNQLRSDYETLFSFTIEYIEAAEDLKTPLVIKSLKTLIGVYQELGCSNVEAAVLSTILGVNPYHIIQISESKYQNKRPDMDSDLMDQLSGSLITEFDKVHFPLSRFSKLHDNIHFEGEKIGLGYKILGLSKQFVSAIIHQHKTGHDGNVQSIINFWFAKWRKQYSSDDYLIQAVMNQTISESKGRELNQKRSNHELLVYNITLNPNLYEWGMMLLNAGFDEHPEAVVSALKGGSPLILSELKGINADPVELPPPIEIEIENIIPVLPPIEQRNATTNVRKLGTFLPSARRVANSYTANVLRQECTRHGVDPGRRELSSSGLKQYLSKIEMVTAILESHSNKCDYEFCLFKHRFVEWREVEKNCPICMAVNTSDAAACSVCSLALE